MIDKDFDKTIEISIGGNDIDASEICEDIIRMPTMTTPNDIREHVKNVACKVFQEMLIELCPELLGYGAIAVGYENDFRKRLEEQI